MYTWDELMRAFGPQALPDRRGCLSMRPPLLALLGAELDSEARQRGQQRGLRKMCNKVRQHIDCAIIQMPVKTWTHKVCSAQS